MKAFLDAVPYIAPEQAQPPGRTQLKLETSAGKDLSSLRDGTIDAGDTLVLTAKAFDYEGLPIASSELDIQLALWKGKVGTRDFASIYQNESMKYVRDNLYYREIAIVSESADVYTLILTSTDGQPVRYQFAATKDPVSLYIAIGLASV